MRLIFDSKTGLIIIINFYLLLFSLFSLVSMSTIRNVTDEVRLKEQPSVVVIGAGAAGVAATSELVRAGFKNVTLLEAEKRIGGRIHTQQLFKETLVDLGAEFYEGLKEDAVWEMAAPYHKHFLAQASEEFKLYNSHGSMVNEDMRLSLFTFLTEFQENEDCNQVKSVGECFEKKYADLVNSSIDPNYTDFLKRSKTWSKVMLHLFSMAPDLYNWGLGTHPVKGPLWSWKRYGYRIILDVMLGKWPNPLACILRDDQKLLNKEVIKIENWREEDRKIIVKCADRSVYQADHVICTLSLGVLKATQSRLFEPVLPKEKQEAIEKTGFGPLLKIVLHFKEEVKLNGSMAVVWDPDEFKELIREKDLHWLQWLSFIIRAENNNKVLICFYTGPGVHLIESLPEDVVMVGQKYLTYKVLKPQSIVTDFPDEFVRTSWSSNPHFRGVNSYKTVLGDFQKDLAAPLPSEENPRLMFAGEATHPEYYSTVHGAVETGLNQAWRIIELYKNTTTNPPF